jgi:hypothetical protein
LRFKNREPRIKIDSRLDFLALDSWFLTLKNYLRRPNPPRLRPKLLLGAGLLGLLVPEWLPNPPLRTGAELLRLLNDRCDDDGLLMLPRKLLDDIAGEVVGLNVLTVRTRL